MKPEYVVSDGVMVYGLDIAASQLKITGRDRLKIDSAKISIAD